MQTLLKSKGFLSDQFSREETIATVEDGTATTEAPATVSTTAPRYTPSEDRRLQDGLCILQDLRDGHTGAQIYSNMLEWKLKDQPGAEAYLTSMIVEQQLVRHAETFAPTVDALAVTSRGKAFAR